MYLLRDLENRSQKHKIRAEVKQRFGGSCAYCGCTPPVLTLDHVVAKCKGGFDVRSNLVGACRRCNNSKKSKELWQWWQSSSWWCEVRAERLSSQVLICKMKQRSQP
ncbi:MAG: HNH endonuclease [Alkalinema sp. CAN_BIN05]|nr:HNH endonuclease [Alkalinema sp. CAN_BIN05]